MCGGVRCSRVAMDQVLHLLTMFAQLVLWPLWSMKTPSNLGQPPLLPHYGEEEWPVCKALHERSSPYACHYRGNQDMP